MPASDGQLLFGALHLGQRSRARDAPKDGHLLRGGSYGRMPWRLREHDEVRDRYWSSAAGRRHQRAGRSARTVEAFLNYEPERKGPRGARQADEFRIALQTSLRGQRLSGWPRAALALDLRFTTTRKQPPKIERLAKHYLDLLEPGSCANGETSWRLYNNDRQVKMLSVAGRHDWDVDQPISEPSIYLGCRTRTDAIAELESADEIASMTSVLDEDARWGSRRDPSDTELMIENARYFESSGDEILQAMAADIRFDVVKDLQDEFLMAGDRLLTRLFRSYARELLRGVSPAWRRLADLSPAGTDGWDDLLADLLGTAQLFLVPLPPPPSESGQGAEFKRYLHDACSQYIDRHRILSPLVAPLRVTIMVVPPVPKDLDNLALEVLPVIEQHFRPHREPWLLGPEQFGLQPGHRASQADDQQRRALARLRSVHEYGVWAYQAIELHRRADHPPHGWMAVMLGHGENALSLWEAAAHDVDRLEELNP